VGLVSNTPLQQQHLVQTLESCGADVVIKILSHQFSSEVLTDLPHVDAWLVDLDLDQTHSAFDVWLDGLDVPIIFGDGFPPAPGTEKYPAWFARMEKQLTQLAGEIHLELKAERQVKNVCVLAASTGGPAAVKTFIDSLSAGLDVAFVYVQHIDRDFDKTLINMMSRDSHYPAYVANHGAVLRRGHLALVTPNDVVKVLDNGTFCQSADTVWPGAFSPSIDQVIANLSQIYGSRAGAIVFTGMGEDGLLGCRLLKQQGGYVWAQTPESCVSESMPEAVLAAELVTIAAAPEQLAKHLNAHLA
jgi:chemosensory pili system protein ChpB (putative protein-glutamate methylesterase)